MERKRKKTGVRFVAGDECYSPRKAAEFLGCCRSKLDDILARSRQGKVKPALSWYRDTARSPIWIKKSSLEEYARQRGEMRA